MAYDPESDTYKFNGFTFDLIYYRRGEWSFRMIEDNKGNYVHDFPSDPYPKAETIKKMRYFAYNCEYFKGLGWCYKAVE